MRVQRGDKMGKKYTWREKRFFWDMILLLSYSTLFSFDLINTKWQFFAFGLLVCMIGYDWASDLEKALKRR